MDFTLTADQELVRDTARTLLSRECPTSLLRAHMDDPTAADPLWRHLREWTQLGGGPLVDLCLFVEETGAVAAPGPFFATTVLFSSLLRAAGHQLADAAVAGEVTGTVAWAGSAGEWSANADAVKTFVIEADRVDHVAIVVPGPAVVVSDLLPARQVTTLDSTRRVFEVDTTGHADGVAIDPADLERVLETAWVALAAEMLGTARWLFDATLAYAQERIQFDRPIGSFQAIQHKLANMALARERAWSAVYYAAMAIDDDDPDRHRASHVAKASAGAAATLCAKDGVQIHGGIGFTWEHDLHLFIRRAYASEHLLGTTEWHHDRLGEILFV